MGPFEHLNTQVRRQSLDETFARAPKTSDLWLFAYGSLIWRPCFAVQSRRKGVLHEYQRRFCVYTVEARGTPDLPGLGLGLEPGPGLCSGVLLSIPHRGRDQAL
nr:gamma-glutamylcyclotransferase [Pseudomonadales bacterium]